MIPVPIPASDMAVLKEERYTHLHPRVQRKLHALYLVGLGYPRHDVNPHPKTAALDRHAITLREAFTSQPPIPFKKPSTASKP